MSAKQHYSALNLNSERGGVVPGENAIQAQRVACAMQVPGRSDEKEAGLEIGNGDARTEVWRKDQGA